MFCVCVHMEAGNQSCVRPHEDQKVDRKSPTCLHLPTSLSVSSQLLYLSTVAVSFDIGSLQYEIINTPPLQISNAPPPRKPQESETDERERLLQQRRERERNRRDSETAVQREERLSVRRMRDRARRAAQTVERRQSLL